MIQSKRTEFISARTIAAFTNHSAKEWKALRPLRHQLYENCRALWTLRKNGEPIAVIGITEGTLLGKGAEVYFLLCKAMRKCVLELMKFLRRAFHRVVKIYHTLTVSIETSFEEGAKFVKFFGFRPASQIVELQNVKYQQYELRASWL